MSELIKHECGVALVRLLKPLDYYVEKYGTPLWGFNKLFLLMEKQHNRGQDGVGIGCVKLDVEAGMPYMSRDRELKRNPLDRIFTRQLKNYDRMVKKGKVFPELPKTVKQHFDFGGEVLLGHLRYGTSGSYSKNSLHPYVRRSNWPTRSLMLAGNFNMTNLDQLNAELISRGQHPIFGTDTQTVLEEIGFHLDEEHQQIYHELRNGGLEGQAISNEISRRLDPAAIIQHAAEKWDGGYTIAGMIGNGDAFALRDPHGIRPCFYTECDEYIAFASERVALMTIFGLDVEQVKELEPGTIATIKNNGELTKERFTEARELKQCSFERIYFSRGNDPDIYQERRALGAALVDQVSDSINGDLENTVFGYIPNTAEIAYYGFISSMRKRAREVMKEKILQAAEAQSLDEASLDEILSSNWPRSEKVAHKDIKMRTFISQETERSQMASHVYDITYGVAQETDNLVCLDDSIVRGTTLRESILRMLMRFNPKKIIIASTAPQIRYPDCYGIDMSEFGKFIAFEAAIELLKETGKESLIREVYEACVKEEESGSDITQNHVSKIYAPFTEDIISTKIAELVRPKDVDWDGELRIIFQNIDDMHKALPHHSGDWYFTGKFPTSGGRSVINRAYINYYEKKKGRSY